jgi:Peptidase MA superfamily
MVAGNTKGLLVLAFIGVFTAVSVATYLGRSPAYERAAQEALADLERSDVQAASRVKQALAAYDSGDSDTAIRAIEKAVALRPRDRALSDILERWRREASVHNSYVERPAEHFRILYEGGTDQSIGDRVARVLEDGYTRIGKTLNSYPSGTTTVILYTNREFQDVTRSPAWATGRYDGRIRVAVGNALQSPYELDRIVTHELVHAIVASAAPRGVPAWLNEGLAAYLESTDRSWAAATLRGATPLSLETLITGFSGLDEQNAIVAYAESAIAAEILCTRLGSDIARFLQLVGNGSSVDQALLEFQVQPNAFQAEWRRRVGLQ